MTPLPAPVVLDAYFLEARSKLLDLAAIFDRLERGQSAEAAASDPRCIRLKKGIEVLLGGSGASRAQALQELFSLPYDPNWTIPQPR